MKKISLFLAALALLSGGCKMADTQETIKIHPMVKAAEENPWRARYAWFWYNSDEIWKFSQEDMDAKVKKYADAGFTHLITFSCTHFRWMFKPWWPQINECIRKIVVSAHKYGLKVIEHHSSHLTKVPKPAPGDQPMKALLATLKTRKSRLEDWPGLVEYALDGTKEQDQWCQIDAVTGKNLFSQYMGFAKCPNNPDYMAGYLKYLESVYALGVDGIMTDDMYAFYSVFWDENGKRQYKQRSCACKYCKKLFKEKFGYNLPGPDKWDSWYGSMDDPTFIDFLKFRRMTFWNFHQKVVDHYKSSGLNMIRPNYDAVAFTSDQIAAVVAEIVPAMDVYFQECMYGYVIRSSWLLNLTEQKMRAEYSRYRKIPHMMMFYANRQDTLNFTFGLCKLAGAMYTNTPEGENNTDETPLRNFEDKYHKLLFNVEGQPVVGFLNSPENRFYSAGFMENKMTFWLQSAILRNIPSAMCHIKNEEDWKKVPVLVLNETRLLSAEQIRKLKEYAGNGGTLVLTGICGEQDEKTRFRSKEEINALWGIDMYDESYADSWKIFPVGKGKICRIGYNFAHPGTGEENKLRYVFDQRRRSRNYVSPQQQILATPGSRSGKSKLAADYNLYSRNMPYIDKIAALLKQLAGNKLFFETEFPDMFLSEPYYSPSEKAVAIHIVNAADTLPKTLDTEISHDDIIPFPAWKGKDGIIRIKLPGSVSGKTAFFTDLSLNERPLAIRFDAKSGLHEITLPGSFVKDYGMICVK